MLDATVRNPLLFGLCSANLREDHLKRLRATQISMLRRMVAPKRDWTDLTDSWVVDASRRVAHTVRHFSIDTGDVSYHKAYHSFIGHISRMGEYDKTRLAWQVQHFRNWASLQDAVRKVGGQGHGRKLHVWRYESHMYKYYHEEREIYASDRER